MLNEQNIVNIGFICSTYDSRLSTNHSFRLNNLNKENLIRCVEKNLEDFIALLRLSEELGCKIFRLGSNFIPFASHPNFNKNWLKDISSIIKNYVQEIKKFRIRVTMHPGQYVVLSTENKKIIKRSLEELKYHFWILEQMDFDENSIVVIHGGGTYGNKDKASKTLIKNINKNYWLKERLALENDEKSYKAQDILEICNLTNLPFVLDYFHHKINYSPIKINEVLKTWGKRIPEFHISSAGKKKTSHGDYIHKKDFFNFLNFIFSNKKINFQRIDVLLEAKKKELAVKKLLREIKNEKYLLV